MAQPILTHCPECNTRFQVTEAQLKVARGLVRCGNCLHVFAAQQHQVDATPPGATPPDATRPATTREQAARPSQEQAQNRQPSGTPSNADALLDRIPAASLKLRQSPRRKSPLKRALGATLCLLALLALAAQYLWFERDRLAYEPRFEAAYALLCARWDCQLRQRVALELIRNQQLVVRTHNAYENVLIMDLLIENQAPFAQPFPMLEVSFSNLAGDTLAKRRFKPEEYLGGDLDPGGLMPSRQPIQLSLELLRPGREAVNYQIRFVSDADQL